MVVWGWGWLDPDRLDVSAFFVVGRFNFNSNNSYVEGSIRLIMSGCKWKVEKVRDVRLKW